MPKRPQPSPTLEEALQAVEQGDIRFRLLVALSSAWYWEQDAELRFTDTLPHNDPQRAEMALGNVGKRGWELPGAEPVNFSWEQHQRQLAKRQPFRDLIVRRNNTAGEARYIKVSGAPHFSPDQRFLGYRGIAEDITQDYLAALALRESESRNRVLAEMVEQSTDAIYARDLEGRITYWNFGAERLYGFTSREAVGQPLGSLHLRELNEAELSHVARRIRQGIRQSFEARRLDKEGRSRDVAVSTAPLRDAQGEHVGEVVVVRDVTAAKRIEAEMQQAREAAESANHAKSEFLANMSHEIRTPLNGILGMTRLVLDGPLEAEQRQLLSLVMASGNALATVINDILDFSKIEAGKLDIEAVEFQPGDLVPDIVRTLAVRAREKGLELICNVAPDVPQTLIGDPGRLRQVLLNLVGNALKFTERGEIEVGVSVESRLLDAVILCLCVRDTGIGIAAHQQRQIFDAFAQAESGTTRRYGGTGLGLTISARLVELMGGGIDVVSAPGRGSQFNFTVRCGLAAAALPAPGSALQLEALRGIDVLVVEDNETYREVLTRLLGSWGMTPHSVPDGETGLALLQRSREEGRPFRLVLLDLILPGLDGFEVAEAIRRLAPTEHEVLMMITANGQRGDAARCRQLGIRGYLSKPVKPSELLDGIVATLAKDAPVPASALVTRHSLRERISNAAILLVEDNEVNRVLATTILARLGHQVTVAADGAEAVELCARCQFNLVLMDMQMPVLDGLQATARIRAMASPMRRVPIIALTANALSGDRERCLEAGMDDYLPKPFDAEQLAAMIDQWLPGRASGWASTAGASIEAGPREVPVLDTAALEQLRKASGTHGRAFLERIIGVFLADSVGQLSALRTGVDQGDAKAVHRCAHSLKSSAAALGAARLSQLCRSVEFGAASGDLEAVPLERVERAVAQANEALRVFLAPKP